MHALALLGIDSLPLADRCFRVQMNTGSSHHQFRPNTINGKTIRYEPGSPVDPAITGNYPRTRDYISKAKILRHLKELKKHTDDFARYTSVKNWLDAMVKGKKAQVRNTNGLVEEYTMYTSNLYHSTSKALEDHIKRGDLYVLGGSQGSVVFKIEVDGQPVDETECTKVVKEILDHYYAENSYITDFWTSLGQTRSSTNKLLDFSLFGIHNDKDILKAGWEVKTKAGDSIESAIIQSHKSLVLDVGDGGEHIDEITENGIMPFHTSSIFVVIVKATKIAFLEKYTYEHKDYSDKSTCVPLTLRVDDKQGIENLELERIMDKYRNLAEKSIVFPVDGIKPSGKFFVFDLIEHHEAVHEIMCYMRTNLPRIHHID